MTATYNGKSLEGIGTTLSISARGDSLYSIRAKLYDEGKKFFGPDHEVFIPDELDMVITSRSGSGEGKYFASAYVKGLKYERAMELRQDQGFRFR